MVYDEEGGYVRCIGGESITNYPNGIDISDAGDILIGDSHGNRFHVAVFSQNGSLLSEFECPHVKVNLVQHFMLCLKNDIIENFSNFWTGISLLWFKNHVGGIRSDTG